MISIIIPTLNEVRRLPGLLEAIREQRTDHEVIVVDGGSTDRTVQVAQDHEVRILAAPPGRGAALSIGAGASHGEVLLFLHVDSTLRPGALDKINEILLTNPQIIGGNFLSTATNVSADGSPHSAHG
jgi:glycosyltransferase involved in cell wall biosynthesis